MSIMLPLYQIKFSTKKTEIFRNSDVGRIAPWWRSFNVLSDEMRQDQPRAEHALIYKWAQEVHMKMTTVNVVVGRQMRLAVFAIQNILIKIALIVFESKIVQFKYF